MENDRLSGGTLSDDCAVWVLELHGCVMDYACRHRHMDVVYEICRRHGNRNLSTLNVPEARLASACLYKIVFQNNVVDFPTALQLAEVLFSCLGSFDEKAVVRNYAKLSFGLKIKILYERLRSSSQEAFCLLREYFPHGGDSFQRKLHEQIPALAVEMKQLTQDFRKYFLPLIGHRLRRENFFKIQHEKFYGQDFSQRLAQRTAIFLSEIEKDLPDTCIEELLKAGIEAAASAGPPRLSDVMTELLLDCLDGKTSLQESDLLTLLDDITSQLFPSSEDHQHILMHDRLTSSLENQPIRTEYMDVHSAVGDDKESTSGNHSDWEDDVSQHQSEEMDFLMASEDDSDSFDMHKNTEQLNTHCQQELTETFWEFSPESESLLSNQSRERLHCDKHSAVMLRSCNVSLVYHKIVSSPSGNQYKLFS